MASQRGKHTTFGVLVIFLFGQDRLELRRDHGRDHGSQRPVTRECRIRITLPTGHIQAPTRHRDKRRTEPSRHPPPRTASHRGTGGWWSRPHQSELRGRARVEGPLIRSRCRWPLPAHTKTILKVVRISRPLDALDFVNRISTAHRRSTDDRAQCRETAPCRRPRACKTNGSTCTGAVKLELRGRR